MAIVAERAKRGRILSNEPLGGFSTTGDSAEAAFQAARLLGERRMPRPPEARDRACELRRRDVAGGGMTEPLRLRGVPILAVSHRVNARAAVAPKQQRAGSVGECDLGQQHCVGEYFAQSPVHTLFALCHERFLSRCDRRCRLAFCSGCYCADCDDDECDESCLRHWAYQSEQKVQKRYQNVHAFRHTSRTKVTDAGVGDVISSALLEHTIATTRAGRHTTIRPRLCDRTWRSHVLTSWGWGGATHSRPAVDLASHHLILVIV